MEIRKTGRDVLLGRLLLTDHFPQILDVYKCWASTNVGLLRSQWFVRLACYKGWASPKPLYLDLDKSCNPTIQFQNLWSISSKNHPSRARNHLITSIIQTKAIKASEKPTFVESWNQNNHTNQHSKPMVRQMLPSDAGAIAALSYQLGYPASPEEAGRRIGALLDTSRLRVRGRIRRKGRRLDSRFFIPSTWNPIRLWSSPGWW